MFKPILCFFLVFSLRALAQTEPTPFHFNFPTGKASWEIKVKSLAEGQVPSAQPAPKSVVKMKVTQSEEFLRSVLTWSDDSKTEVWMAFSPKRLFLDNTGSDGKDVIVFEEFPPEGFGAHFLDRSVFTWISPSTFVEKQKSEGRQCFYFTMEQPPRAGLDSSQARHLQAWIDEKTGLPVAYSDAGLFYSITFDETPSTETLILPTRFLNELALIKSVQPNLTRSGKFDPKENGTPK